MILAFLCIVFLLTIFIGIPLAWAIIITTLAPLFAFNRNYPLESIYLNFIAGIEPMHYIAIPMFIVAGEMISRGGVGLRIVNFSRTLFGFLPGGLGICVVASCMIFGGISGSAIADSAAIGSIMIPAMVRRGYSKAFSAALVAAAGTIGIIVPPSIPMLVYGFVSNVSVAELFVAGIVPGILFGCAMMVVCVITGIRTGCDVGGERASLREIWYGFIGCAPALFMPFIILGGIFSGIVTPTEAAALAAVYGFIVAKVVYRDLKLSDLPSLIVDSFITSAIVLIVIGSTQILAYFITLEQMPQLLVDAVQHLSSSPWVFLLLVNIVLLILGHVLEPVPAILLTAPLFLPMAKAFGIDPVHLGLIMTCNLALGLFTPPVGATLFVASKIANIGMLAVTRAMGPLFLVSLLALLLVTYIDAIPMSLVWLQR
jgi:C4-dicarboxylate transporter, DctM subunit